MRKIMKCEGFELIWNTLSLSKLKEITRSRFTWRVGTEKRSRTPLFLYNFQHDTPLRIDCISNMLNLHFLPTGKNIVHKSSICPPTWLPFLKLCIQSSLQVFPCMVNGLIQFTWQPGLFTGNPPSSSSSSPVNSTISVRSFTFPAPGQTSMPNFPHAAFTHSNRIFSKKKCGYIWVELFVIVSENYFPASCLKFGSKFFFYNLCNCLGIHLFQFKTVFWLYWRARSFLSLPRTM